MDGSAENGGPGNAGRAEVPALLGMTVTEARQTSHHTGLVVISADPEGAPLGGFAWPGSGLSLRSARRPPPALSTGTTWCDS